MLTSVIPVSLLKMNAFQLLFLIDFADYFQETYQSKKKVEWLYSIVDMFQQRAQVKVRLYFIATVGYQCLIGEITIEWVDEG